MCVRVRVRLCVCERERERKKDGCICVNQSSDAKPLSFAALFLVLLNEATFLLCIFVYVCMLVCLYMHGPASSLFS